MQTQFHSNHVYNRRHTVNKLREWKEKKPRRILSLTSLKKIHSWFFTTIYSRLHIHEWECYFTLTRYIFSTIARRLECVWLTWLLIFQVHEWFQRFLNWKRIGSWLKRCWRKEEAIESIGCALCKPAIFNARDRDELAIVSSSENLNDLQTRGAMPEIFRKLCLLAMIHDGWSIKFSKTLCCNIVWECCCCRDIYVFVPQIRFLTRRSVPWVMFVAALILNADDAISKQVGQRNPETVFTTLRATRNWKTLLRAYLSPPRRRLTQKVLQWRVNNTALEEIPHIFHRWMLISFSRVEVSRAKRSRLL